jgi:hypothetical protein
VALTDKSSWGTNPGNRMPSNKSRYRSRRRGAVCADPFKNESRMGRSCVLSSMAEQGNGKGEEKG